MKNLKEFIPLVKLLDKEKKKLIFASTLIFMSGIAEIFTGYLNGAAVEEITKLNILNSLMYFGIYFFIEITLDGYFVHKAESILYKVESLLTRRLGFNAYKKALDLPAVAYEKYSSGEIINRITNDADSLSFAFGRLLNMFTSILASIIIMVYVFINSWIVGIYIILILGLLFGVIKIFNPKLKEIHKERKKKQDKFTSLTTESIRGIREIKTLGIKNSLISNMSDIIKEIFKTSSDEIDIQKRFNIITRFIKSFLEVGTFIICAVLLYKKMITLTFFVAMTYYVYRYMWLIENLNDFTQTYQKTVVAIGRVNDILENRLYDDDKFGNTELEKSNGLIEFKDVCFSYPDEPNILNNFNIKLIPNKKIAIVGRSGQGKSTLFNLITRIFDPNNGEILIDGINIKDIDEKSLRKNISIIRQEPFTFNRTIRENFELIDKNIKLKSIRKYTKMAYLDEYIMSLPKKYDTILGEGGVNLSGGQKQRLSIARALSKNSKIILFDEATSALDNQSQSFIKKVIDDLVKDHTIVIVAHRLSTIIDADIIYVVDGGKVVDYGSHKELLKTSEIYKRLYTNESLNSEDSII